MSSARRLLLGRLALLFGLSGTFLWFTLSPPFGLPSVLTLPQMMKDDVDNPELRPRKKMAPSALAQRLRAPAGFAVSVYAQHIGGARMLRFTSAGDLLISSPVGRAVLLISPDRNGDGAGDQVRPVLSNLDAPHGIDLHDGQLYVAEGGAVFRVPFDEKTGQVTGKPTYLVTGLPKGGHWTRSLRIGPDDHLYVSIGSSCNVCIEKDRRRAAIVRYDLDGKNETIFASGLRNSVGLAFHPQTGKLYATDNGRDLLGDDFPPCELNLIEEGVFYGWPFANGNRVKDPDFGAGHEAQIAASRPPIFGFRAHNAPLGITFDQSGAAFVGLHGSWNRSTKDGYKVVRLTFAGDKVTQEDFLTGFLDGQTTLGRPVDVAVGPDGAYYVSDDLLGAVYRVGRAK